MERKVNIKEKRKMVYAGTSKGRIIVYPQFSYGLGLCLCDKEYLHQ